MRPSAPPWARSSPTCCCTCCSWPTSSTSTCCRPPSASSASMQRSTRPSARAAAATSTTSFDPRVRGEPPLIVYQASKSRFVEDVGNRGIEYDIAKQYLHKTGRYAPEAEVRAWRESLTAMATVLDDDTIPSDTGVGVEFGIPQTSKRIDFLLTGRNGDGTPHVIIVELKQWSTSTRTDKRSEEHTSELQSRENLVCRLL